MRISDCSSDVCSSDLEPVLRFGKPLFSREPIVLLRLFIRERRPVPRLVQRSYVVLSHRASCFGVAFERGKRRSIVSFVKCFEGVPQAFLVDKTVPNYPCLSSEEPLIGTELCSTCISR